MKARTRGRPRRTVPKLQPLKVLFAQCGGNVETPRGYWMARTLIVTPPIMEDDLAFTTEDAIYVGDQLGLGGFKVADNALIISCTVDSGKASKANTAPIAEFVRMAAQKNLIDCYLSIGREAFKHAFGRGRMGTMSALKGNILRLPDLKGKELMVVPELDLLNHNLPEQCSRRDYALSLERTVVMSQLLHKIGKWLKTSEDKRDTE